MHVEDENEDLSKLDDGSNFVGDGDGDDAAAAKEKADAEAAAAKADKGKVDKEKADADAKADKEKADVVEDKNGRKHGEKGRFVKDADGNDTEEEEEEDEEDEEEEDDPDKDDPGKAKGGKTVPYARFAKLVAQRNALNERVEKLESTKKVEVDEAVEAEKRLAAELESLYEKVEEARADNDTKEAARLQRQIDKTRDQLADQKTERRAKEIATTELQNSQYDSMVTYLEQVRPVLDPNSEEFDERVVKELDFQVRAYEKMGMAGPAALRRAAALIFVEDPFRKNPTPKDDTAAKGGEKPAKPEKPAPKKTDIEKNADASKRTPARAERTESAPDTKLNVAKLTEEEFLALPKSKLSELSGDFL